MLNIAGKATNVDELLDIDESNLSNEFAHQAAIYGWISNLVVSAEAKFVEAKQRREEEYAACYVDIRQEFDDNKLKYTESKLDAEIKLEFSYQKAKRAENEAERKHKELKALAEALRMRADMLISMGATIRSEQQMLGMHINDKPRRG